jgi:restriction system protein
MARIITGIKYFIKFYIALLFLAFVVEIFQNPNLIIKYWHQTIFVAALIILYTQRKKLNFNLKPSIFLPKRFKWKLINLGIIFFLVLMLFRIIQINNLHSYVYAGFIAMLCIGIIGLIVWFITNKVQEQKIAKSGINEIDLMSGVEFEEYLKILFINKGYKVETTPSTGDFGADLIIVKNGQKAVVQAKRYNDKVSLQAVQEVVGALAHYKCTAGLVITNNYFTPAAIKLAQSNNIKLWDRNELIKEILS